VVTRARPGSLVAAIALIALAATPAGSPAQGLQTGVVFTESTPFSRNAEIGRRVLSPLDLERIDAAVARSGKQLSGQPIDLAAERFTLYVPRTPPPGGYGLLVFVPPWDEAIVPSGWGEALDRSGLIFVTAARSGNDQNIVGRRIPLALAAAANVMRLYAVDPARVYVAGFSGGSRTALRLALGYPDLFHGALLMAGSDPLGQSILPLPPRDLFPRFQEAVPLVYLTGADDAPNLADDAASMRSMQAFCVTDFRAIQAPGLAHAAVPPGALAKALQALAASTPPPAAKLAACREAVERRLTSELDAAEAFVAAARLDDARKRLSQIDRRYGGLAAPRILDLWKRAQAPAP